MYEDYLYLLVFPVLAAGLIGVGDWMAHRMQPACLSERLGLALAGGTGILALVTTFLGIFHILRPGAAWIVLLVFAVYGVRWVVRQGPGIWKEVRGAFDPGFGVQRILLVVSVVICLINAWFCLSPEIRHDPYDYHLTVANLYAVSGGIVEIPWHVFSYMPKYGEMLYAFILLLGPDILGKLLHWSAGVAVILLTAGLGNRIGGRLVGWISAFLAATLPLLSYLSTTCYVDLFVAMWSLAAIACFVGKTPHKTRTLPLMTGSRFLGMVMGAKYVAWATVAAPVLVGIAAIRWPARGILSTLSGLAVVTITAIIIAYPWLCYNGYWTHNPTYPLLGSLFGRHIPACQDAEAFFRGHAPPAEVLSLTGYWPYLGMRLSRLASEGNDVFFLGTAAALFYLFRKDRSLRFPSIIVLLSSLVFLLATDNHEGRFFFATLMLCSVLTAQASADILSRVSDPSSRRMLIRGGWAIGLALIGFWAVQRVNQIQVYDQQLVPKITTEARESLLRDRFPGFGLVLWANENLPQDAVVLGLGYPLERRYISKNKHGYLPWLVDQSKLDDPEHLANVLRNARITHVTKPWPSLKPNVDLSILFPIYISELWRDGDWILYAVN